MRTTGGPSGKIAVIEEPRFVPTEERQRVAGDGRSLRQGQSRAVHGFGQPWGRTRSKLCRGLDADSLSHGVFFP
jgi:hypothetical protein